MLVLGSPIERAVLPSDTVALARRLLGMVLVHEVAGERLSGRIVETEAYVPGDASSHAFRGPTRRNASMFLELGRAYIYLIYGSCHCLNVVSESKGVGAAVLVRALEPLEGIATMRRLRGVERLTDLARGPGRLTQALGIGPAADGADLCSGGPLRLEEGPPPVDSIGESVRIGITREAERVLRFYVRDNPFVSGPKRLNA